MVYDSARQEVQLATAEDQIRLEPLAKDGDWEFRNRGCPLPL